MPSRGLSLLVVLSGLAGAQVSTSNAFVPSGTNDFLRNGAIVKYAPVPSFSTSVALPRMTPDLAVQIYQNRTVVQREQITECSSVTVIRAELPDLAELGVYELQRQYAAPHTLRFKALNYIGDGFVKNNVIPRLLQSEQDHVQKTDAALTDISTTNYKFSYLWTTQTDGRLVHAYEVKPRVKRFGLFRGRIYLDAFRGSLVRAEGSAVKLASFALKKAEFVEDYADFGKFTFPVHLHSEAHARFIGRAIVDVYERDYQAVSVTQANGQSAIGAAPMFSITGAADDGRNSPPVPR
jgi:hypothetical protein